MDLQPLIDKLQTHFSDVSVPLREEPAITAVLGQLTEKLLDNYPYPSARYAGQMLKPPHPIARYAYYLAMHINPNNHALDGGKATSALEKEVIQELGQMIGWENTLGHLTSGGTLANLEALWIAHQIHPGKCIVASEMAHYTHARISEVLKIPFQAVAADVHFRMDLEALEDALKSGNVGTVVVTLGNTSMGSLDNLTGVLSLRKKYAFRIHVDAAYGGYFLLADGLSDYGKAQYAALKEVDSFVIDPHKHGLQPYGCGCILFRDQSVGMFYKHDSPYTYFTSDDLHLGEISLECSRAGASAAALWATMQLLPLEKSGAFGQQLDKSLLAAQRFRERLTAAGYQVLNPVDLDIVTWMKPYDTPEAISDFSDTWFDDAEKQGWYFAKMKLSANQFNRICVKNTQSPVTILRSCLMKPEHLDIVDEIPI